MQFFLTCLKCQGELGRPSFEPIFAESFDARIIQFTCSRGHDCHALIQSPKFELLLESGASALSAGFTLEAVGAYAAALERFYEFSTKAINAHLGMTEATFQKMFSQMAVQSERQFGAFMVSYALLTSEAFAINSKIPPFRNKVIHRGYIPTREEAFNYCSNVYDEILRVIRVLQSICQAAINKTIMIDLKERHSALPSGCHPSTYSGGGVLSLSHKSHKDTFQESYSSFLIWLKSRDELASDMHALFNTLENRSNA